MMAEKEFDPEQPQMVCVNCGEKIWAVGPELWHVESTTIWCADQTSKAEAFTDATWREFRDYWIKVGEGNDE
jgi:hypothetical protein